MKLHLGLKKYLLGILLLVFTLGVTAHISNVEAYINTDLKISSQADFDQDGNVETRSDTPDYVSFAKIHHYTLFSLPKISFPLFPVEKERDTRFIEPHLEFQSDYLSSIFRPPIFA